MLNKLLWNGYEFLSVLLPCLVIYALFARRNKRLGAANSRGHSVLLFMFIVYIAAAGCFTGMGSIYDAFRGIQLRGDGLHLIPFADAAFRLEHLLNIALFIPFGFLLPLAWPQAAKLRVTLLFGVSFSLLIELSQLLNHRVTDTDDLLMNACGCLLGWAAFRLFVRIVKRKPPKTTGSLWEPGLYLVVMLLGRLLLFNGYGLSMILMRL